MSAPPLLAYVEPCLPAPDPRQRLELALSRGLALELADDGSLEVEPYRRAGVQVASVQAYRLHEDHPLSPQASRRRDAARHVAASLELAARLEARRVVAICSYGHDLADAPFERCLDFFASLEGRCRELGVRLLLEPLSPLRTAAFTDPAETVRLLDTLDAPEAFGLLLDVGHLADGGTDLEALFAGWDRPVEELQLRGPSSAPPDPEIPVAAWIEALPIPPSVVAVEHREPIAPEAFEALVAALRTAVE